VVNHYDQRVIRNKAPVFEEHSYVDQDGEKVCFETRKFPVLDDQGKVTTIVGISRDITDRKMVEEALRQSELWMRGLFNAVGEGVLVATSDRCLQDINPAAERIFGYTKDEVRDNSAEVLHPSHDHYLEFGRRIQQAFDRGESAQFEFEARRKNGEIFQTENTVSLLRDASGETFGIVRVVRDISERKRAEKEREQLRSQLFQAQKMEAIGTLTGGIAHDFNNLLTIINGYTELILSEKTEDDPNYSVLKKILQTGRKGAELVQRLLALSRKGDLSPRPLELNSVIENSVALMKRTFPKIVEIETVPEKDLGMVNGDAEQVEQVLMNLCINAKEAMPEGGKIRIETKNVTVDEKYCRLHPEGKPGSYVLIEVSDTGTGMHKETRERMFDPFFSTKGWDFNKGIGLGLSVAKGIVEQHSGWIGCQSELGKGTTFRIYFPVIEDSPGVGKFEPLMEDAPGAEKILLVDDEENIRDLGKRILERSGHSVVTAANGREALDIYAREQSGIALVILDLIMPQMGGEKCLEELVKINPHVKVIISTGHSLEARERLFLGALAKGFVNKPYGTKQLVQIVRDALHAGGPVK